MPMGEKVGKLSQGLVGALSEKCPLVLSAKWAKYNVFRPKSKAGSLAPGFTVLALD